MSTVSTKARRARARLRLIEGVEKMLSIGSWNCFAINELKSSIKAFKRAYKMRSK